MVFRLTQKAAAKLRMKPAALPTDQPSMLEWYCNVVRIERRQFFLFAQATSLFSFWAPVAEVPRQEFGRAFRSLAVSALRDYGFGDDEIAKIIDDDQDVFATTADRGVVGSMVDFAKMMEYRADHPGGLDLFDRRAMNDVGNECPMSRIEMDFPAEYLRRLLRSAGTA